MQRHCRGSAWQAWQANHMAVVPTAGWAVLQALLCSGNALRHRVTAGSLYFITVRLLVLYTDSTGLVG